MNALSSVVVWCWRHAILVCVGFFVATIALGWYAGTHLGLDTDQNKLISEDIPFRKLDAAMTRAFPASSDLLVVIIDGPTVESSEAAVNALGERLSPRRDLFYSVRRAPEESFFRAHGLLFMDIPELTALSDRLTQAQPLLGSIARDPSLRGLLKAVNLTLEGVARGQAKPEDIKPLTSRLDAAAAALAAGEKPAPVSWQSVLDDGSVHHDSPQRILLTQPILHFGGLEAGDEASQAIRAAAVDLGIIPSNGFRLRLTGDVALSDANFATIADGLGVSATLSFLLVAGLLWVAVRSWRVVVVIEISLVVGLALTAAFAAGTVGSLNPISVAFAVMFLGIAVDFAIQFTVCLAECQTRHDRAEDALAETAHRMAGPLPVAALATALGFLSFLPTDYTGVSQLGLIAGAGMVIALVVDFTLLPALLALAKPAARAESLGLPLQGVDTFIKNHHGRVTVVGLLFALVGALLVPSIAVDFNPLHLQDPKAEAVSAFLDLAGDPDAGVYAVDALTASPSAAAALAARFDKVPGIGRTLTLQTFVPEQQAEKRAILDDLLTVIGPTLNPTSPIPAPSDDDLATALAATIAKADGLLPGSLLVQHLKAVQSKGPAAVRQLDHAVAGALPALLVNLRTLLAVEPVSLDGLPAALRDNWVTRDGQWRVQAAPSLPPTTHEQLVALADSTRHVQADISGPAISVVEAGRTVTRAFVQAGVAGMVAIVLLLAVLLRRSLDALLVLAPLLVAALLTVIAGRLLGLSINFANIIALPLLLGIGVAFNIYFVVNWRNGVKNPLTTGTARAVWFSALTTGAAFGSLALSPHVGTASMGILLFLSLGLTLMTTFLWLPALLHWIPVRPRP